MSLQRQWSAQESRAVLEELAVEFWDAASDVTENIERQRELAKLRGRAALRLVPTPKMGYEHIYWQARESSDPFED
jgi:hypothetical protein